MSSYDISLLSSENVPVSALLRFNVSFYADTAFNPIISRNSNTASILFLIKTIKLSYKNFFKFLFLTFYMFNYSNKCLSIVILIINPKVFF